MSADGNRRGEVRAARSACASAIDGKGTRRRQVIRDLAQEIRRLEKHRFIEGGSGRLVHPVLAGTCLSGCFNRLPDIA